MVLSRIASGTPPVGPDGFFLPRSGTQASAFPSRPSISNRHPSHPSLLLSVVLSPEPQCTCLVIIHQNAERHTSSNYKYCLIFSSLLYIKFCNGKNFSINLVYSPYIKCCIPSIYHSQNRYSLKRRKTTRNAPAGPWKMVKVPQLARVQATHAAR